MRYKDKKEIYLLSTAHSSVPVNTGKRDRRTQEPILKPQVVNEYNKNMNGVDMFDQNLQYYSFNKNTLKWWKRAATHLIHVMKVQAHIIYAEHHPRPEPQLDFTLTLIEQMLKQSKISNPTPPAQDGQRVIGKEWHYLSPIPPTQKKTGPTRNCKVCTIYNSDRTPGAHRFLQRRESRYESVECGNIPLCVHPCHKLYHSVQDYNRVIRRHLGLNHVKGKWE